MISCKDKDWFHVATFYTNLYVVILSTLYRLVATTINFTTDLN